jgi:hypothetical protein
MQEKEFNHEDKPTWLTVGLPELYSRLQEEPERSEVDPIAGVGGTRAHLVNGVPHVQLALLLVLIFLVLHVDIDITSGAQLLMLRGKKFTQPASLRPKFKSH